MKIYEFDPVIYPIKLYVTIGATEELINKEFEEWSGGKLNYKESPASYGSTYTATVVYKENNSYGILVNVTKRIVVKGMAHEATHAARFMWEWLNESYIAAEADAYLVGWITDCIYKIKTNKVTPIKEVS